MLISSEAGGGQLLPPNDETRFYDDVACLAADWASRPKDAIAFVRVGAAWIDASASWYARSRGARTAMGSGIVAFASAGEARAADRDGRAISWTELTTTIAGGRP